MLEFSLNLPSTILINVEQLVDSIGTSYITDP